MARNYLGAGYTYNAPLTITDPSTNSIASLTLNATADANGANFRLVGNGATTPSKTFRANGGVLQVVNDAYSAAILTLTDAGVLSTTGGISNTPISGSSGSFTTLSASSTVSGAGITSLLAPYALLSGATFTGAINTNSAIISTLASGGSFRLVVGNYGIFDYSDGTCYYKLLTNTGAQLGSYNGLRPFYITLSSGYVTMGNGVGVVGGLSTDTLNVTGTTTVAQINATGIYGPIAGSTGSFTTLSASSTVSGAGITSLFASPPAIGGTAPAAGSFTTLTASGALTASSSLVVLGTFSVNLAATFYSSVLVNGQLAASNVYLSGGTILNIPISGGTGSFTTLAASGATTLTGTVSGAGITSLLAPYALLSGATFSGAISAFGTITAVAPSAGYSMISSGSATNTGFLSFYNAAGTRQGYIGYALASGYLALENENGCLGYNVTGALTVAGMATLSGGITGPSMNGGMAYANYNFNALTNVYQTAWCATGSTNGPASIATSVGNGYYFGMGGGDVANRGFQLLGGSASGGVLWFREISGGAGWVQVATLSGGAGAAFTGNLSVAGTTTVAQINATGIYGPIAGSTGSFTTVSAASATGGPGLYLSGSGTTGVYPALSGNALAINQNFAGGYEGDFFNCQQSGGTGGFNFYQMTGTSAATLLMSINRSGGLTATSLNGASWAGLRNKIHNGNFAIFQRNAATTANTFACDRWAMGAGVSGVTATAGQSTTTAVSLTGPWSGYVQSTTAKATLAATDLVYLLQNIEGTFIADLLWGSASASAVTLSFRVQAPVAGTYSVALRNGAGTLSYVMTFTLASANTTQAFSFTIPGPTTGTWPTGTGASIALSFCVGTGSTYQTSTLNAWVSGNYVGATTAINGIATANNGLWISDVQLEAGTVATPFERRMPLELAICQRYFQSAVPAHGLINAVGAGYYLATTATFAVTMRAAPTLAAPVALAALTNCAAVTTDFVTASGFRAWSTSSAAGGAAFDYAYPASADI